MWAIDLYFKAEQLSHVRRTGGRRVQMKEKPGVSGYVIGEEVVYL